jgi:hypothetical protein
MREGPALSRSLGIFEQGNGQSFFRIHEALIRDYRPATVQPGMAMTVKEMGVDEFCNSSVLFIFEVNCVTEIAWQAGYAVT